jgi:hypothetical protein
MPATRSISGHQSRPLRRLDLLWVCAVAAVKRPRTNRRIAHPRQGSASSALVGSVGASRCAGQASLDLVAHRRKADGPLSGLAVWSAQCSLRVASRRTLPRALSRVSSQARRRRRVWMPQIRVARRAWRDSTSRRQRLIEPAALRQRMRPGQRKRRDAQAEGAKGRRRGGWSRYAAIPRRSAAAATPTQRSAAALTAPRRAKPCVMPVARTHSTRLPAACSSAA